MKSILEQINEVQLRTLCDLESFKNRNHLNSLPTKHRGLYWLWSNFTLDELENTTAININKEVPINQLISHRKNLNNICNIKVQDYLIVYNGIGGYNKLPAEFGLRERINQEIIANGTTVGTLNIQQRSDISRWAVSYFDFDSAENMHIIRELNSLNPYIEYGKNLEMLWRLHYGTPILTRH
jgi:hypothetical protein